MRLSIFSRTVMNLAICCWAWQRFGVVTIAQVAKAAINKFERVNMMLLLNRVEIASDTRRLLFGFPERLILAAFDFLEPGIVVRVLFFLCGVAKVGPRNEEPSFTGNDEDVR